MPDSAVLLRRLDEYLRKNKRVTARGWFLRSAQRDLTMEELAERIKDVTGLEVSVASLYIWIPRLGLRRKRIQRTCVGRRLSHGA